MKKPSKVKTNILIMIIVVLLLILGILALIQYGRIREYMETLARRQTESEVTVTPQAEETPTPEPEKSEPDQREELIGQIQNAMEENDVQTMGELLRYASRDGTAAPYVQEDLAAVMLHLKKDQADYWNFFAYLRSGDTVLEEGEETAYLLLHTENLRKLTNTAEEPAETLEAEEVTPAPEESGIVVAIDAGHQAKGNSDQEPVGPGSSTTKAKVASGTSGRTTGVPEYQLNLDVSLKLRDELEQRGYQVFMIRETNEVDISNAERAQMAAEAGADILVRIHANGSENTSVAGALTMAPSAANPYLDAQLIQECQRLAEEVLQAFCTATGADSQGVYQTDDMSGLNWCTIPATIVEMGYMTNQQEDTLMQTEEYQNQMVQGIANGIDQYFAS